MNRRRKIKSGVVNVKSKWVNELDELPTLKEASHALIREALKRAGYNQRAAATMLGISPQALNQRIKRFPELVL